MDLHGGSISVHSEGEGKGTTFSVKLPVYRLKQITPPSRQPSLSVTYQKPQSLPIPSDPLTRMHRDPFEDACGTSSGPMDLDRVNCLLMPEMTAGSKVLRVLPDEFNSEHTVHCNGLLGLSSNIFLSSRGMLSVIPSSESLNTLDCKKRLRFLLVDDVALTRKMMRRLLNDRSSTIDEAGDGQQAVDMLKISCDTGTPYDIVLMDYQMPIMDGPSAAQAMRQLGYTGLILGVSGHTLEEDSEHFLSSGADKVLTKPINLKELDTLITNKMSSN